MQPCVRACPVEVDDSTFAQLINAKGMKLSGPTSTMESTQPMGEPEGEPGCRDAPTKQNPTPLLDIDGKPGSVFVGCGGTCIRRAGMCMMVLSAIALNLTVIAALSQSWKSDADTRPQKINKKFRVPVKFPVESSTSIMRVSSDLTPISPTPAKASKAEAKQLSNKSANSKPPKAEKAPAPLAIKLPPQVASG